MTDTERNVYIYEMHRQGLNDAQIAERLGIPVEELVSMMVSKEKTKKPERKVKKEKPAVKTVSGAADAEDVSEIEKDKANTEIKKEKKTEDLRWMDL